MVRPAGDFHSAFWPLALGTLMAIFGHTPRHALWIVFALGLVLPPLVFFVTRRADPRSRWLAPAIAAVMVASLGRLHPTLVTPDITLSYQLATMGGLCAWMSLDGSSRMLFEPSRESTLDLVLEIEDVVGRGPGIDAELELVADFDVRSVQCEHVKVRKERERFGEPLHHILVLDPTGPPPKSSPQLELPLAS